MSQSVKAIKPIQYKGVIYEPGDFIHELSDDVMTNLIEKGAAEKADVSEIPTEEDDLKNTLDGPGGENETPQEILDLNFNTTELKDGATELGLIFPGNISKKDIIALIIENDGLQHFVDQLED